MLDMSLQAEHFFLNVAAIHKQGSLLQRAILSALVPSNS